MARNSLRWFNEAETMVEIFECLHCGQQAAWPFDLPSVAPNAGDADNHARQIVRVRYGSVINQSALANQALLRSTGGGLKVPDPIHVGSCPDVAVAPIIPISGQAHATEE